MQVHLSTDEFSILFCLGASMADSETHGVFILQFHKGPLNQPVGAK